jgi:phosphatidylglycerophosphatase A
MRIASKILSTVFGLGCFPAAPGTLASIAAALLYRFVLHALPWPAYAALIVVLFFIGALTATIHSRILGQKDPGVIVIDEVCGQLAALILIPASWPYVLAGFILFRVFDILKPFPIRRFEHLPAGWGIMADDMAAAVFVAVLLHIFLFVRGAWLS